jgi:hypothetical protein
MASATVTTVRQVTLTLTEDEANALEAILGLCEYGTVASEVYNELLDVRDGGRNPFSAKIDGHLITVRS